MACTKSHNWRGETIGIAATITILAMVLLNALSISSVAQNSTALRHPGGAYAYSSAGLVFDKQTYIHLVRRMEVLLINLTDYLEAHRIHGSPGPIHSSLEHMNAQGSELLDYSWVFHCSINWPIKGDTYLEYYRYVSPVIASSANVELYNLDSIKSNNELLSIASSLYSSWLSLVHNYYRPTGIDLQNGIPVFIPYYLMLTSSQSTSSSVEMYVDQGYPLYYVPWNRTPPYIEPKTISLANVISTLEINAIAVEEGDSGLYTLSYYILLLEAVKILWCLGGFNVSKDIGLLFKVEMNTVADATLSDPLNNTKYYEALFNRTPSGQAIGTWTFYGFLPITPDTTGVKDTKSGVYVDINISKKAVQILRYALFQVLLVIPSSKSLDTFISFAIPTAGEQFSSDVNSIISDIIGGEYRGTYNVSSTVTINASDIQELYKAIGSIVNPSVDEFTGGEKPAAAKVQDISYNTSIRGGLRPSGLHLSIPSLRLPSFGTLSGSSLTAVIIASIVALVLFSIYYMRGIYGILSEAYARAWIATSRLIRKFRQPQHIQDAKIAAVECYRRALRLSGAFAGDKGFSETPREYLRRASPSLPISARLLLGAATRLYEIVRYGRRSPPKRLLELCDGGDGA